MAKGGLHQKRVTCLRHALRSTIHDQSAREDAERKVDPRVDLAVQRTELAFDRTLLAWVRTVIGLIGAGVALDKGLELLHEARLVSGKAWTRSAHSFATNLLGPEEADDFMKSTDCWLSAE